MNLFEWTPPEPTRKMIPFPQDRRKGEISRVAIALSQKKEKPANKFWSDKVAQIRRQMTRAGFAEPDINAEIASFHEAVRRELDRMAVSNDRDSRPGDGAA